MCQGHYARWTSSGVWNTELEMCESEIANPERTSKSPKMRRSHDHYHAGKVTAATALHFA